MKKSLLILSLIIILSSCSLDDQEYTAQRAQEIERADIVLTNAVYTLAQENEEPIRLESGTLSYWIDRDRIEAERISFIQLDGDGNTAVRGSADNAVIDSSTKVMNLEGNVRLESLKDDLSISTQYLIFDTQNSTVSSEDEVSISFDGGSITGYNLSADLIRLRFDIQNITSGEVEI